MVSLWWSFVLLIVLLFFDSAAYTANAQSRRRSMRTRLSLKFYNIEHCRDKEHALRIHNVTILFMAKNGGTLWDVECELLAPVKTFRKMNIIINKCRGAISPSLCEYDQTLSWGTAICTMLAMPGMLWTPLVQNIRPPFGCPVAKGPKTVKNVTIDLNTFDRIGVDIEKFIWLVEFQLTNEHHDLHLCLKFAMEPRRVGV